MAKIYNSRAKVYETRGVLVDEPTDHVESEGERIVKEMVQKQLDTNLNLQIELNRKMCFTTSTEIIPLTEYTSGESSLKEFQQLSEEAEHVEELKTYGLTGCEIQIMLDYEKNLLAERHKKRETSSLSSHISAILKKIEEKKKEISGEDSVSSSLHTCEIGRHERELGLCVKPESKHTKLLNFVLSCQKRKTDSRPLEHPIYQLKDIEQKLFQSTPKKFKYYLPVSSKKTEISEINYEYSKNDSLWDVKSVGEKRRIPEENSNKVQHAYTCKREYLYTIKNKQIVPLNKSVTATLKTPEKSVLKIMDSEFVVTDSEKINMEYLAENDIKQNKLLYEDIKALPKFSNYKPGTPSKILYLKNLSRSTCQKDLVSLFSRFETMNGVRIVYRLLQGKMQGQAFVTFASTEIATLALELVNGYLLKGKPIIVQYGKKSGP